MMTPPLNAPLDLVPFAPKRRWSFSLRTLFVVVTVSCVWLGYELNWIRERENLVAEWRAMGGETVAGSAPWPIRILGAHGVARFQFGYFGGYVGVDLTRPIMSVVNEDVRDKLTQLFPESRIEMVSRW